MSDTNSASQRVWKIERILGDRAGAWREGVTGQERVGRTGHHRGRRSEGGSVWGWLGSPVGSRSTLTEEGSGESPASPIGSTLVEKATDLLNELLDLSRLALKKSWLRGEEASGLWKGITFHQDRSNQTHARRMRGQPVGKCALLRPS